MKRLLLFTFFITSFLPFVKAQQHYDLYGLAQGGAKDMGVIYRYDLQSNTFDTVMSFNGINGTYAVIMGELVLGTDDNLYGLTAQGGLYHDGVMYRFNPLTFKDTVLINFDSIVNGSCYDYSNQGIGAYIMQAKSGLIYGTTVSGGSKDSGVFFSYNINTGKDSVLFSFNNGIGAYPIQAVTEDTLTGILYGTTIYGGTNNLGVIYSYNPFTNRDSVIFNFDSIGENGAYPIGINFCPASDGLFYGMTTYGGTNPGDGTLYSFNPATGKDTTLIHNLFGGGPWRMSLLEASNDLLYGVYVAGADINGSLFSYDRTTNTITIVHNFTGSDGSSPSGGVTQNPDNGLLYGITNQGGTNNGGVLYSYNITSNTYTVLHNFDSLSTLGGSFAPWLCPTLVRVSDTGTFVKEIKPVKTNVKVYPNPATNLLNVAVDMQQIKSGSICLYNTTGQEVECEDLSGNITSISINKLSAGLYYYRILNSNGSLIKADKITIVH
ncbi:MAG: choice-of-anchor tandem repeat GloVer-containing protein [Bacteroidia bacterium]